MPKNIEPDFEDLLEEAAKSTGVELVNGAKEVAAYAAQRAAVLATLVGRPGYQQAVIAERDNVALFAGVSGVDKADAGQQRLIGIIQGALALGAKALV